MKVLVIQAHPLKESFSTQLAENYKKGAEASGADCEILYIADMKFDPVLRYGYTKRMEAEPDLIKAQELLKASDHIVIIYPNWWATYPALLKGFLDRVFVPGIAFRYRDDSLLWDKLLTGKSARIIITMDTPRWYYWLVYRDSGIHAMKTGVLKFCGINPVRTSTFSPMKTASEQKRTKWLDQVEKLGRKLK